MPPAGGTGFGAGSRRGCCSGPRWGWRADLVLGRPIPKGLGYMLGGGLSPMGGRQSAFGHPGMGGAIGFADPEYRFALALCKNRMTPTLRGHSAANRVARAVREALGIPEGIEGS